MYSRLGTPVLEGHSSNISQSSAYLHGRCKSDWIGDLIVINKVQNFEIICRLWFHQNGYIDIKPYFHQSQNVVTEVLLAEACYANAKDTAQKKSEWGEVTHVPWCKVCAFCFAYGSVWGVCLESLEEKINWGTLLSFHRCLINLANIWKRTNHFKNRFP